MVAIKVGFSLNWMNSSLYNFILDVKNKSVYVSLRDASHFSSLSCMFGPNHAHAGSGFGLIQATIKKLVGASFLSVYACACLYVCFVCACVWVLALWRGPVCVTAGPAPPGSKQYWQTHQSWWCIGLPACSPSRPQRCCRAVLTCCHLGNCCQSEWPAGIADPSWRSAGELQQEMSPAGPLRTGRPLSLSPTIDPSAAEIRHHPGRSLPLKHTHTENTHTCFNVSQEGFVNRSGSYCSQYDDLKIWLSWHQTQQQSAKSQKCPQELKTRKTSASESLF